MGFAPAQRRWGKDDRATGHSLIRRSRMQSHGSACSCLPAHGSHLHSRPLSPDTLTVQAGSQETHQGTGTYDHRFATSKKIRTDRVQEVGGLGFRVVEAGSVGAVDSAKSQTGFSPESP